MKRDRSDDFLNFVTYLNTGSEYEVMTYLNVMRMFEDEETVRFTINAIKNREDSNLIFELADKWYDKTQIKLNDFFNSIGGRYLDVYMTSNVNNNGPSDIVFKLINNKDEVFEYGFSIKYDSNISFNPGGGQFLTIDQKNAIKNELHQNVIPQYFMEMKQNYGNHPKNYFRKQRHSEVCGDFLNMIAKEVILNWKNVENKKELLEKMFNMTSSVDYHVLYYSKNQNKINIIVPKIIDSNRYDDIKLIKGNNVGEVFFVMDNQVHGVLVVKFCDGPLENTESKNPDFIEYGVKMKIGNPFGWHFKHIYDSSKYKVIIDETYSNDDSITTRMSVKWNGRIRRGITNDEIIEIGKKYKTRCDFKKNDFKTYKLALNHKLMDKCIPNSRHTVPCGWWNDKKHVIEERLKYETKGQFGKGCNGAYQSALKNGYLDALFDEDIMNQICPQMGLKSCYI